MNLLMYPFQSKICQLQSLNKMQDLEEENEKKYSTEENQNFVGGFLGINYKKNTLPFIYNAKINILFPCE